MTEKLQGKWLNVSAIRFRFYPDLIEFDNDKIKRSLLKDFSTDLVIPEIRDDKFDDKISSLIKIENVESDRVRIFKKGIKHKVIVNGETTTSTTNNDAVFEIDYVRLLETKSNISESRLQLLKYQLNWKNEKLIIEFNKILDKPYIQEMNEKINQEGHKILLEKLDQTLFVSIINNNIRGLILPIKDVNGTRMILYGFPEKPYEVTAERIK